MNANNRLIASVRCNPQNKADDRGEAVGEDGPVPAKLVERKRIFKWDNGFTRGDLFFEQEKFTNGSVLLFNRLEEW